MRTCKKPSITLTIATNLFAVACASAQPINLNPFAKPKIPVPVQHPAAIGIGLTGKKVAFGEISGACAQQFSDQLTPAFQANGVEVVNREHLNSVLAEHKFQVSSSVDPTTAVQLGKVLGPSIMIFVTVTRCNAEHKSLYADGFNGRRTNISRTEAHFLASVHTVDLATGRDLAVQSLEANPQGENSSQTGIPEFPSEIEIQDEAIRQAVTKAKHLYFPWTETRSVSFMNSKECNMKQAYDALRGGDTSNALKLSQEGVDACKSEKVNHQANAWYNLGIVYALNNDYDKALDALNKSNALHSDKTVLDAIAEVRRAKSGADALAGDQKTQSDDAAADQNKQAEKAREQADSTLTNETIIEQVKNAFSADLILHEIASQPARFSVKPADLLALKKAGVPDAIISAMLDKK